jgi:proteasome accessory factor A
MFDADHKRVMGTETEFGLIHKGDGDFDPVAHSLLLLNSDPRLAESTVLWDYEGENPLLDARGFEVKGERERPEPQSNKSLNKVLLNGGRFYVDGAHPEYSTPECTTPRELVRFEKAGERIAAACRRQVDALKGGQDRFLLYKNNTDGKGNSYGYHENYLLSRAVPFDRIVQQLTSFLVTRQIFCGAGKVGGENKTEGVPYQIAQRSDFFETLIGLNTMINRPIINTRDEPHADPDKYRRVHIIVGDANMSEVTTYLKVGTAALVLDALEAGALEGAPVLEDPVRAIKEVSRDLSLRRPIPLERGGSMTALEIQQVYLERVWSHCDRRGMVVEEKEVLRRWDETLMRLAEDPMQLNCEIDWVIKRVLLERYMSERGCGWNDPRIAMMDLQYHDIRRAKGLYYLLERAGKVERILTDMEIEQAQETPPEETRAYFRGVCAKKFPRAVYAASWSSLLFDVGGNTIKRIPMLEPLRGSRRLLGEVLDSVATAEELLGRIAS